MVPCHRSLLALVCCVCAVTPALAGGLSSENGLAGMTAAETEKVLAGGLVVHSDERKGKGTTSGSSVGYSIIHASPEVCWEDVNDYAAFVAKTPRLKRMKLLAHDHDHARVWQELDFGVRSIAFTLRVTFDHEARAIRWERDLTEPSDITNVKGGATFFPAPSGETVVKVDTFVDSGFWAPAFFRDWLVQRDLPQLLGNIRSACEARAHKTR